MRLVILLLIAVAGSLQSQELSPTTPPKVTHKTVPEYTKEALDAKLQGFVTLSAVVGVDGLASEIKVVGGLGKGLDEKAIECLQQWRFKRATNSKLWPPEVPEKVTIEINFRLPPQ
jgi:periplasmic protein TonB